MFRNSFRRRCYWVETHGELQRLVNCSAIGCGKYFQIWRAPLTYNARLIRHVRGREVNEEARQGGGDRRGGAAIWSVGRGGGAGTRGRFRRGVVERVVGYYNQRQRGSEALVDIICVYFCHRSMTYCITFWLCTRVARESIF